MSKAVKLVLALGLVGFVAACAQQEEVVVPEPITVEPVEMGKYK
jgi:nitrous oxide reductase accessory protein NosL